MTFTLFSAWHFFYIALTVAVTFALITLLKNKSDDKKLGAAKLLSALSFALYIADFFLMPLAYGEIEIEKLPFHACTAMCVCVFLSYRIGCLENYRASFAALGFISNFVYLVYPAGVMWQAVSPLSYRTVQTLLFHGLMSVCCLLTLLYGKSESIKAVLPRHLAVTCGMTAWAMLGNCVYNGEERVYNWFFVVGDPFGALPESIAPFIMPFLNIALFFAVETAVILTITSLKRLGKRGN